MIDLSVDDPMDLAQTGWAVLFASDVDPSVREALKPLLEWRQNQVNDEKLFKVFEGTAGVRPGQTAGSWASAKGVSFGPITVRAGWGQRRRRGRSPGPGTSPGSRRLGPGRRVPPPS